MSKEKLIFKYLPERGKLFLKDLKDKKGLFICTIAHTETSKIPGISSAGANTDLIEYTPAADVEAIYYGKAKCLEKIPENPFGPPSPVIISIASLNILKLPFLAVNCGVKIKPEAPIIEINNKYGENIEFGNALKNISIKKIKDFAFILAKEFSKSYDFIVLGESVPGGTTTAMALISALGVDAYKKISGSMPGNNHELKIKVVKKALSYIKDRKNIEDIIKNICDPMQPFQAFFTIFASNLDLKVILAGGTQMVAVAGLIKKLGIEYKSENISISTTGWVSEDKHSDIKKLMEDLKLEFPLISGNLDFSNSKYKNLQMYEQGFVKEGVGAGALAMLVFYLRNYSNNDFLKEIEKVYERIYL